MRLVMIDNYDSFTYNLVQLFYEFDLEVLVFRHDGIDLNGIADLKPDCLCISPGPKGPDQAGISKAAIAHFYRHLPILGVCLGHQALNEVFGGATVKAPIPVHGKRHPVFHAGRGLFQGLPSPFGAARYHSLMAVPTSPELEVTAWTADGVVMGLQHRRFPLHGVQFHPESFLTSHGHALAANFLELRRAGFGEKGLGAEGHLQSFPQTPIPNHLQGFCRGAPMCAPSEGGHAGPPLQGNGKKTGEAR